jgi:hypothetical protein
MLGIFLGTILALILQPLPTSSVALIGMSLAILTKTESAAKALSGFANTTVSLIVAGSRRSSKCAMGPAQRKGGARRAESRLEPYARIGAGAITLGVNAALANGCVIAYADDGSSVAGDSSSAIHDDVEHRRPLGIIADIEKLDEEITDGLADPRCRPHGQLDRWYCDGESHIVFDASAACTVRHPSVQLIDRHFADAHLLQRISNRYRRSISRFRLAQAVLPVSTCAALLVATLGLLPTVEVKVRLLATDALIMTGSGMPVVEPAWMNFVIHNFIQPSLGGDYIAYPVTTPEQFWPFTGLMDESIDNSIAAGTTDLQAALSDILARHAQAGDQEATTVVFGYSQSTVIATRLKRELTTKVASDPALAPVVFVLLSNLGRPNGGLYARFPGLFLPIFDWSFGGATPTQTPFMTIDVARQYDPFVDFPLYPLNLLADANTLMGLLFHDYGPVTLDPTDPRYDPDTVVQHAPNSDTTYYLIPAKHLPLLQPLRDLGVAPRLLDAIEPTLRVLIELGYDRTIPYGEPTPARLIPQIDLGKLSRDLAAAVKAGIAILTDSHPVPAQTAHTATHRPAAGNSQGYSRRPPTADTQRPSRPELGRPIAEVEVDKVQLGNRGTHAGTAKLKPRLTDRLQFHPVRPQQTPAPSTLKFRVGIAEQGNRALLDR